MPSPLGQQVLVVQAQNGVNMASGTATTAPSTAALPLAGPSKLEPIVPIGAQLGAQDTPSVIQGARPVVSTEQTMQSTQGYGTLPYLSSPPSTAPLPYAGYTAPLPSTARLYLRPLQRHFHSLGLTDRFTPPRRSDPLVLANLLRYWQDQRFLTSGIPIRTFQAEFTIFTDASTQGWGAHMGDSQISGTWTHTDRKLHISCLELKAVIRALKHWAPVLQGL